MILSESLAISSAGSSGCFATAMPAAGGLLFTLATRWMGSRRPLAFSLSAPHAPAARHDAPVTATARKNSRLAICKGIICAYLLTRAACQANSYRRGEFVGFVRERVATAKGLQRSRPLLWFIFLAAPVSRPGAAQLTSPYQVPARDCRPLLACPIVVNGVYRPA